jgi:hypothetical protein
MATPLVNKPVISERWEFRPPEMFLEADWERLDGLTAMESSGFLEAVRKPLMAHLSPTSTICGRLILPFSSGRGWEGAVREGHTGCTAPWTFQIPQTFLERASSLPDGPIRAATSGFLVEWASILSAEVGI